MKQGKANTANQENEAPDITVHIVGSNRIGNELMASFLEEQLTATYTQREKAPLHSESENGGSEQHLVLVDCQGRSDFNPWSEYDLEGIPDSDTCYLTFYNVHPDAGIESTAISCGVCGVFYNNESVNQFPRGLRAILDGELWFSRRAMADLLRSSNGIATANTETNVELTQRELEILHKIAGGADNGEISTALFISPHTVKSHIYSIYKKINVKNRFQAILWAIKNLQTDSL